MDDESFPGTDVHVLLSLVFQRDVQGPPNSDGSPSYSHRAWKYVLSPVPKITHGKRLLDNDFLNIPAIASLGTAPF